MSTIAESTLEDLVNLLKGIEAGDIEKTDFLTDGEADPDVEMASYMGTALLITKEGRPDYKTHKLLEAEGFRVGPGETDSCGWLTGIIYTQKGKIVFG
jgi:hypothetical protein